jgi:hypothetical protein
MATKQEHMKTKALLAAKKNASCMVNPFKSVEMEALLLFIKFQKCADLRAQQEDSNSLDKKATAHADVTSVPKDFECETNVTIGKYYDLQVRFDSHKGATSDGVPSQPAAVCGNGAARRHAFAALQVSSHTYSDRSCSKSFKPSQTKVFTLRTTIPSKTTVHDHMEPKKTSIFLRKQSPTQKETGLKMFSIFPRSWNLKKPASSYESNLQLKRRQV